MQKHEYGSVEWLWKDSFLRINLPKTPEQHTQDAYYQTVVEALTALGQEGWEVATSVAQGNWIYWTLKRPTFPN
jgi:hypothetical protein